MRLGHPTSLPEEWFAGRMTHDRHVDEPHVDRGVALTNRLRASVLGADDGIVSTAAIIVGVIGADAERGAIFTAGLAGLVGGAVSMAVGEYVSVSSQRDRENALLAKERQELIDEPEVELIELTNIYRAKGLSAETALLVAKELTAGDAFTAHVDAELGIDPEERSDPTAAAIASAVAFTVGAALPLLAVMLAPSSTRLLVTVIAVLLALGATGAVSARVGGASVRKAVTRIVLGGGVGLAFTYAVGAAFGTAVS